VKAELLPLQLLALQHCPLASAAYSSSASRLQDAGDLYNADYAQTQELFRQLIASSAGGQAAGGWLGGDAAHIWSVCPCAA
jgi:hypothetical protein